MRKSIWQLVLPRDYRRQALWNLHNDMGHLGRGKTLDLVHQRFLWPHMASDVEDKIRHCDRCIRQGKTPYQDKAPMTSIKTSQPLELVCMDFLTLESSQGGYDICSSSLIITQSMPKPYQPGTRQPRQSLIHYSTTSSSIMVFLTGFTVTKAVNMRVV